MDLANLTYLELLELRRQVNVEIEELDKRKRVKIYSIFSYGDWNNYISKESAANSLKEIIDEDEIVWDDEGIKTCARYIDEAHLKYCKDYKEE